MTCNDTPLVSIVTPSFNQGLFINETISSVLAQSYPDIEYIIVDGASTDSSLSVISRYTRRLALFISEPDTGQASAINKGLLAARGEILGWINSDDILYKDTVSLVVSIFNKNPEVDVVYGNVDYGPSTSSVERVIKGMSFEFVESFRRLSVPMPQQGCFWRRSALKRCGLLNEKWHYVLDRDYFIRLADKCILMYVDSTLGLFRSHPKSKSVAMCQGWSQELVELYKSYYESPMLRGSLRKYRNEVMAAVYLTSACLSFKSFRLFSFFGYIVQVLKVDLKFVFRHFFLSKIGFDR